MDRPAKTQFPTRAPRVTFPGNVSASIHLENGRQLSGKLRTLSITGGLLDLALYLDERTQVSLMFRMGPGILQSRVQMLFPMRGGMGYLQPFRFTSLGAKERQTIEAEIATLTQQAQAAERSARGPGLRPGHFYLEPF